MKKKVADILSDQDLYSVEKIQELESWNKKFSEIGEAINRAESLWMQAQKNLENIKLSSN
jgi:ATP-binding cassette subfamily F protein 3